ncbi:hypothetical protein NA56DRAFT_447217 [Hyaloscypha hepaticicola]|uniref:Uncharacterized protein n=1 Tax=Hyaloscypha hepaticicola TaxID=2082293 RepID=A0A2J6PGA1_9HELO|nr:hypothetical protein NA56DRAFT_447217 [Hyaloscypha hepaticicola]
MMNLCPTGFALRFCFRAAVFTWICYMALEFGFAKWQPWLGGRCCFSAAGRETDTVVRSHNKNIGLALNQLGFLLKHHMPSGQCHALQGGVRGSMVVTDFSSLLTGHGYLGGWGT